MKRKFTYQAILLWFLASKTQIAPSESRLFAIMNRVLYFETDRLTDRQTTRQVSRVPQDFSLCNL